MATVIRKEIRKRGFFGWIFLLIFLGFNALMLMWLIAYWSTLGEGISSSDAAVSTGTAIGGTIGTGMLLFLWVCGSLLGFLMCFGA
jgi:hypothetical protein